MRTQTSNERASAAAEELAGWFSEIVLLWSSVYFEGSTSPAHRDAAILEVLSCNAKTMVAARLDSRGDLYKPLTLVLTAACRRLGIVPTAKHWMSALQNVHEVRRRVISADAERFALPLGTAASLFKDLFCEALVHAGVTDRRTIFVEENRRVSLGLALNWGLRLILAYALEIKPGPTRGRKARDLRWVRSLIGAQATRPLHTSGLRASRA
jgi:hypothetical protein